MDPVTALFVVTLGLYAGAAVLFFVHLWRGKESTGSWATRVLGASVAAHVGFLWTDHAVSGRGPLEDLHQTLAVAPLLIAVTYLATMRRHKLTVLGAFITPVTLLLLLAAGVRGSVGQVPEEVRTALLPLHVGVNVLGLVAFTLAFGVAIAYVIQEGLLRRRQLGGVFQRLPALDVLDSMGLRLVTVGFFLFTLGVVTGGIWASRVNATVLSFSTGQGFAVLAWACFGTVLLSRAAAGWRGRRAAIGTMLGFLCAMAAIAGYLLRETAGS